MKKTLFIALSTLFFAGCVKDMPSSPQTPSEVGKVSDMAVPASFDWKMVSDITCNFTAEHPSLVRVSKVAGAEPLAVFMVGEDASHVCMSLPRALSSICVSYQTAAGIWKSTTLPLAQELEFHVPSDSRDYGASLAATRAHGNQSESVGEIVYPASDEWGTLMYEDLWPSYGDYDFNDLVVNYSIRLAMQNKNKVERMIVNLRVKAVGGSLPYDFYLSLGGVRGGEIDHIDLLSVENASHEVSVTALNSANYEKTAALIELRGLRGNVNRPSGAAYINTERGYEMSVEELVTVSFEVYFRNSIATRDITLDTFDFFVARTNDAGERIEIHEGGRKATGDGLPFYNKAVENGRKKIGKASDFYYSTDRLVWALNIPADVQHTYEKVDFVEAYPEMAKWAQSGGTLSQAWYKHGVPDKLVSR